MAVQSIRMQAIDVLVPGKCLICLYQLMGAGLQKFSSHAVPCGRFAVMYLLIERVSPTLIAPVVFDYLDMPA